MKNASLPFGSKLSLITLMSVSCLLGCQNEPTQSKSIEAAQIESTSIPPEKTIEGDEDNISAEPISLEDAAMKSAQSDQTQDNVMRPDIKNAQALDNSLTTKVVMLGTGTPVPTPDRMGPSTAVIYGEKTYIFDFGPGIVRQTAKLNPRFGGPFDAMRSGNLKLAFITHLHSDHTAGLPDLLLTGWSGGHRKQPLKLFGPEGTKKLADKTIEAFDTDIKYRVFGLEDTNNQGWRIEAKEISEGLVYEDEDVKVYAFPVKHGKWPEAYGYRVETPDKTVVISGDLRPSESIRENSIETDYLVHEVYCERGLRENMIPIRQAYHRSNHTSTKELAKLANEVKPGVLVLTHILPFGCSYDEILEEVTDSYDGKVVVATDMDIYR